MVFCVADFLLPWRIFTFLDAVAVTPVKCQSVSELVMFSDFRDSYHIYQGCELVEWVSCEEAWKSGIVGVSSIFLLFEFLNGCRHCRAGKF